MKRSACIVLALVLVLGILAVTSFHVSAESDAKSTRVFVEDIGTKVTLVGRLGVPLSTMMTLNGKWGYPDETNGIVKDDSLRFTVTHVNGVNLKKPVEFNVAQVHAVEKDGKTAIPVYKDHDLLDGVSWTLRAYETGRAGFRPQDYWKEIGSGPRQSPYWAGAFSSEITGVVQRGVAKPR